MLLLSCLLTTVVIQMTAGSRPCIERSFGEDSIVCVCNATYCDSYDHFTQPPQDGYLHVSTNKDGLRFNVEEATFNHNVDKSTVTLKVDRSVSYQSIMGFGAAFTDAAGINLHSLSEETQNNLLRSYYSDEGIEYNMGRVPIAGTDFSVRPYSYDDVSGDDQLEDFALVEEDLKHKIPVIQEAFSLREAVGDGDAIKLFASPWSAPAWMKSNNRTNHGGSLEEAYYQTWAKYFLRFLEEYDNQGVSFWGLTVQNEPMVGYIPFFPWNSMAWLPWGEGSFVRDHLGPLLQDSPYSDTVLISMDDQRWNLPLWSAGLFSDESMAKWYKGVGLHWYVDTYVGTGFLDRFHKNHPDLFLLNTEACAEHKPILGKWELAEQYAHDILEDLTHYVNGWIDWNFALDAEGGPNWAENFVDSPIIVDASKDEFYKQPSFYALAHFSKFIPRESQRVEMSRDSWRTSVEYGAFLTPSGNVAAVLLNLSDNEHVVNIEEGTTKFQITLTKNSINTLIWK